MAKVFFSYSHADEVLRNELEKHLSILRRQGLIDTWHDRRIGAGTEIDHEISQNLETADVILLLISSDFLASDYCYEKEMKRAMERHESGQACVIPVILRPCDWHGTPFGKLLATPPDGKPVVKFPTLDDAFVEIVAAIKQIRSELQQTREMSVPTGITLSNSPESEVSLLPRSSNLRIKKEFSERERDKFLVESYEFIANFFEGSLHELGKRNPNIEGDFRRIDANHFFATLYLSGNQKSSCKIWLGGSRSHVGGIAYSDMSSFSVQIDDRSYNEILHVVSDGYGLFMQPIGMLSFPAPSEKKFLTQEGAAEFFWASFISPLQR